MFLKKEGFVIQGILGLYVDDILGAGNKEFNEIIDTLPECFETKKKVWDTIDFFGVTVLSLEDTTVTIDRNNFIRNIQLLPNDATF